MDLQLGDKTAFVTGGTHGIGLAIADALLREDVRVAVGSRHPERAGRRCFAVGFDALIPGDASRAFAQVEQKFGRVDILVNNVGGGGRWGAACAKDTDPKVWSDVYQKNAGAAVELCRAAIPGMKARGWGRIVTVSSIHGREAGGRPWFAMAKAAEIALMKSFSQLPDLARAGVTCNTVAPGGVLIEETGTSAERDADPAGFAAQLDRLPAGRLVTPEEVAAAVAFLCSPLASGINGASLVVDGGESKNF